MRRAPIWTDQRKAEALRLEKLGIPCAEIDRRLGLSNGATRHFFRYLRMTPEQRKARNDYRKNKHAKRESNGAGHPLKMTLDDATYQWILARANEQKMKPSRVAAHVIADVARDDMREHGEEVQLAEAAE